MLVYLVGPGKKSLHPFESDGGDILGLLKNGIFLDQNVALCGQIQWESYHSRQRQLQPQEQDVTSMNMFSPTTQQTQQVGILMSKK